MIVYCQKTVGSLTGVVFYDCQANDDNAKCKYNLFNIILPYRRYYIKKSILVLNNSNAHMHGTDTLLHKKTFILSISGYENIEKEICFSHIRRIEEQGDTTLH